MLTADAHAYLAAKEYIAAADVVRLAWQVAAQAHGPDAVDCVPFDNQFHDVAWRRLAKAEHRCRELGLWGERVWMVPSRFWERSNLWWVRHPYEAGDASGTAPHSRRPVASIRENRGDRSYRGDERRSA